MPLAVARIAKGDFPPPQAAPVGGDALIDGLGQINVPRLFEDQAHACLAQGQEVNPRRPCPQPTAPCGLCPRPGHALPLERKKVARRPAGFPDHQVMRRGCQIMAIPGMEVKRGQGFKSLQGRLPQAVAPLPPQRRTFRHHRPPPRSSQGFKVRPNLQFAPPKQLESLQKIPPAAHVGQHPVHALGEPVPIRFGRTVPPQGDVVIAPTQGIKKLVTHRRGARTRDGVMAIKIIFWPPSPAFIRNQSHRHAVFQRKASSASPRLCDLTSATPRTHGNRHRKTAWPPPVNDMSRIPSLAPHHRFPPTPRCGASTPVLAWSGLESRQSQGDVQSIPSRRKINQPHHKLPVIRRPRGFAPARERRVQGVPDA